jgi:hypothetical protein
MKGNTMSVSTSAPARPKNNAKIAAVSGFVGSALDYDFFIFGSAAALNFGKLFFAPGPSAMLLSFAARELAEAGAQVTVLDDGPRPGGQFALAERMKSTPDFHRFAEWSAEENERLGISVRLGSHVDTAHLGGLVRDTTADAIVLPTGGLLPSPGFRGADSANVWTSATGWPATPRCWPIQWTAPSCPRP